MELVDAREFVPAAITSAVVLGGMSGALFLHLTTSTRKQNKLSKKTVLRGTLLFIGFWLAGFAATLGPTSYITEPRIQWTVTGILGYETVVIGVNMIFIYYEWLSCSYRQDSAA